MKNLTILWTLVAALCVFSVQASGGTFEMLKLDLWQNGVEIDTLRSRLGEQPAETHEYAQREEFLAPVYPEEVSKALERYYIR